MRGAQNRRLLQESGSNLQMKLVLNTQNDDELKPYEDLLKSSDFKNNLNTQFTSTFGSSETFKVLATGQTIVETLAKEEKENAGSAYFSFITYILICLIAVLTSYAFPFFIFHFLWRNNKQSPR